MREEFDEDLSSPNGEEFFEHYKIIADEGQAPLRVDKFLMNRLANTSRNRIQNAAHENCVLVNGNPVKPNHKVKAGDVVSIVLPEPPRDKEIVPEDIPLDILYEDEHLLIINKEAGMVVHPGYSNYTGTLVHALAYHFNSLPSRDGNDQRPGLVHRIDKDTSGLLVIAKEEDTMTSLAKQFYDHSIERTYHALIWGIPENNSGTIEGKLARSPKDRRIMQVVADDKEGKEAITHYEVLEEFQYASLIKCKLETGRTHQIRAHLSYLGHPLFADEWYGGKKIVCGPAFSKFKQFIENCFSICNRQALHAYSLGFLHPASKEFVHFEQEYPTDFQELIAKWRRYSAPEGYFTS